MKVLIVDDDNLSVKILESLLKSHFLHIVSEISIAKDIDEAKVKIENTSPQLLFLDVHFPESTGFDLLNSLKIITFEVIITTATENYAIDAYKVNAIDFLLKPVQIDDLERCLNKVINKLNNTGIIPAISKKKLTLPTIGGSLFVNINDICFCEADNNYTKIYLSDGKSETITLSLKELEALLPTNLFFRIHKSFLVNFEKIVQYNKSEGGTIVVEDYHNRMLPVSKQIKETLINRLRIS
ncbi:MAG: LytTR family DNA-binding domain-containing protein [Cytophagales bacterium]|nr:LytTR family DNA-binding domain-containing protein [Cytophagales bacterium]